MVVCLAPNGMNVFHNLEPPSELIVGTVGGLAFLERRDASEWQLSRVHLASSHISSMAVEPRHQMIFAGIHGGGIVRSSDCGRSWEACGDELSIKHVYTLAYSQLDQDPILYAGTEPVGLFSSRDCGQTWNELLSARALPGQDKWSFPLPPHAAHVKTINIDPRDPNRLMVGVEQGGLFESRDGGGTWDEITAYAEATDEVYKDIHQIVRRPSHPHEIAMTSGMGLYYSRDDGTSWAHLTDRKFRIGYPDKVIFAPDHDERLIMCGAHGDPGSWIREHTANPAIMTSNDLGITWAELCDGLPNSLKANIEALAMHVHARGFSLFAGTTAGDVFLNDDGTGGWKLISSSLPPISKVAHYRLLIPGGFQGGGPPRSPNTGTA